MPYSPKFLTLPLSACYAQADPKYFEQDSFFQWNNKYIQYVVSFIHQFTLFSKKRVLSLNADVETGNLKFEM
ncbi:MAG: hypothetical protein DRP37_07895 [Thermodesulfobacteriota bacterium]|nr:MAG: hypothetical protein DRP37_07895 [Thermodesulfobacteriota bacterium]